MMKKITAALAVLLMTVLTFSSCKKDEKDKILGKWEVKSSQYTSYTNGVLDEDQTENFEANENVINFKSNNTIEFYEYGVLQSESGTYSVENKTITIDGETFNFTIDGKSMSITYEMSQEMNGISYKMNSIIKLTKQ